MRGRLKEEGDYELFKTTNGNDILNLDEEHFYALVKGQQGDIIIASDADHKKDKSLLKGTYYYADFDDDPEFQDMEHLFMEDGGQFRELILPEGMPTSSDHQKKLIRESKKLSRNKVMEHLKGKGDNGSEKQYQGKKEGLKEKTMDELYDLAKKHDIEGRSTMNKDELAKALERKTNK